MLSVGFGEMFIAERERQRQKSYREEKGGRRWGWRMNWGIKMTERVRAGQGRAGGVRWVGFVLC